MLAALKSIAVPALKHLAPVLGNFGLQKLFQSSLFQSAMPK